MSGLTRRRLLTAGAGAVAGAWLLPPQALAAQAQPAQLPQLDPAEDGHELWLRYRPVGNPGRRAEYTRAFTHVVRQGESSVLQSAAAELTRGLSGLLDRDVPTAAQPSEQGAVVLGTPSSSALVLDLLAAAELDELGPEGFVLRRVRGDGGKDIVVVASTGDRGVLYGAFHLLRLLQTEQPVERLDVRDRPANPLRLLNHWDNINDTVERGYSGGSIFQWSVPGLSPLVGDYARYLASLGINRTVVNNVNANPQFLTAKMLDEVAAVADALRPWGVTLMLSANFASPMVLDRLPTADPLDPRVKAWWRDKAAEVYGKIPDFGGFLVKANSEGQPGPAEYGRTHADGANVIAEAVAPHGGLVIWRAFVYDLSDGDVSTDAYRTFVPLDGHFADNVVVQAKYGPVDFHVREPVHPLFGAMPRTSMALELQVTQEHTGHATHLCYLVPWWKSVLAFDTYAKGAGTTVAHIVDGSAFGSLHGGLSGVSNFGDDRNWTGHHLAGANAYGYGRLAWDPSLSAEQITDEWVRMTVGSHPQLVKPLTAMLLGSWATFEDYTSPLGIGNLVAGNGDHYDPDPSSAQIADSTSVGFDRTVATGTGFTGLYHEPWKQIYESLESVPDELLLFMHRVPYSHQLHSGKTVVQHIYDTHFEGLTAAEADRRTWDDAEPWVDSRRHAAVAERFDAHIAHATLWRDTIVAYFFRLSRVLDERRSWVQVKLADPGAELVLGGWPNRLPLEIGNASPGRLEVTARVNTPDGWTAKAATTAIESRQFEVVDLPVIPPTVGAIVSVSADVQAGGLPVLGGTNTSLVVAPVGRRCVRALDGGSKSSPLLPGYARLSPETAWDAQRGFGWVGTPPQQRDRGSALDALRRDFCADVPARTLRIAVPPGSYPTYLLVGDVVRSQPTIVSVDGAELARSRVLAGNEFEWLTFTLDGGPSGKTVDLRLSGIPGEFWHLNALAMVDPDSVLPPVVVAGASAHEVLTLPEEPARVVFTLQNTTDADSVVRPALSASQGYQVTVESEQATVPAGGSLEVPVTVVRDPGTPDGTLTFEVGGESLTVALLATDNWVRGAMMSASSTHANSSPSLANNGNTDSEQWNNGAGGWNDGTAGAFPDSLTANWERPVRLGRVKVLTLDSRQYPAASWGLRDYDVQLQVAGAWQTAAEVRGNTAGVVESTFSATTVSALRIVVHDTNDHGYSRIMELEAYE
ncbi:alpha-glucuronidase family glycosyl hydrolase [Micromonospora coerulea]|uniref:alpha-glucuronidase family glycosyl hydrolase n=1 Tax=Micromonospora coerulea TaxID=47856 RepID=UPI00190684E5|nr:alpha-glucuronidase family glycosyl hydrolase [Micromonospora veneta]